MGDVAAPSDPCQLSGWVTSATTTSRRCHRREVALRRRIERGGVQHHQARVRKSSSQCRPSTLMTKPVAPVTSSVRGGRFSDGGKSVSNTLRGPRRDPEVLERHRFIRIVAAVIVAHEDHAVGMPDLGKHRGVVTRAARHLEWLLQQSHERARRRLSITAGGESLVAPRSKVTRYPRRCAPRPPRLRATASMCRVRDAAQVEDEARLAGDLARAMHGGVGVELPARDHQVRAGALLLQPDLLHVVQQRHGGGHRVVALGALDGARVRVLAEAAGVAEALAAADAASPRRPAGPRATSVGPCSMCSSR